MNLNLIELQRNAKATCVVVENEKFKELKSYVSMKADVSDKFLFGGNVPPFKEKVEKLAKANKIAYFVITNLDEVPAEVQNRFVGLVKDREFEGYILPDNVIVVFTVKGKETLKKISHELWNFCVNAI